MICKRSRPVLVLHERKTRITLMTRLAGKTAAETIAAMTAAFRRLDPRMRGSVTFDNDTCFARHMVSSIVKRNTEGGWCIRPSRNGERCRHVRIFPPHGRGA